MVCKNYRTLEKLVSVLKKGPIMFSVFRDLKRDVAKKLEKLEKRTQRAIVELISKW